jgi:hypothetical protein
MRNISEELMKHISSIPIMLVFLTILVLIYHFGVGFYNARGIEPSPAFELLYTTGFLCSIIWWLEDDARKYHVTPVYCLGFLVSIAWMIVIPYHLFKTRGVKGLITIFTLAGIFLVAQFIAAFTYMLFTAQSL